MTHIIGHKHSTRRGDLYFGGVQAWKHFVSEEQWKLFENVTDRDAILTRLDFRQEIIVKFFLRVRFCHFSIDFKQMQSAIGQ